MGYRGTNGKTRSAPKKRNPKLVAKQLKENPLQRLSNEGKNAYRAFLLWGMQVETKRKINPIAKGMDLSYQTVSQYRKTWNWVVRVEKVVLLDQKCQALYRKIFFDEYGMRELSMVERYIAAPISVLGNVPRNIAEAVDKAIGETSRPRSTMFSKEVKRKHLLLIDAAIGYIAAGIRSGDVRRSLRDLPILLQLRKDMTGEGVRASGGGLAIESIRVRDAKANNGDIVDALYEDAVEMAAILQALKSKGKSGIVMGERNEQHSEKP
jgi:hypothetical protein